MPGSELAAHEQLLRDWLVLVDGRRTHFSLCIILIRDGLYQPEGWGWALFCRRINLRSAIGGRWVDVGINLHIERRSRSSCDTPRISIPWIQSYKILRFINLISMTKHIMTICYACRVRFSVHAYNVCQLHVCYWLLLSSRFNLVWLCQKKSWNMSQNYDLRL